MNKRQTILLVERDYSFALLFLYAFEQEHCQEHLRWVTGPHHAQKYLQGKGVYADRQMYPEPDLIVLDLQTLDANGGDRVDHSRKFPHPERTLTAVVGESDNRDQQARAIALGACCYYTKSRDAREVQQMLHEMLDELHSVGCSN